jgi:hypothetical protein
LTLHGKRPIVQGQPDHWIVVRVQEQTAFRQTLSKPWGQEIAPHSSTSAQGTGAASVVRWQAQRESTQARL